MFYSNSQREVFFLENLFGITHTKKCEIIFQVDSSGEFLGHIDQGISSDEEGDENPTEQES